MEEKPMKKVFCIMFCLIILLVNSFAQPQLSKEPSNLFRVVKDGKWGYMDKTGKIVIPLQFACTWGFSEGLAAVMVSNFPTGKIGFIDTTGRIIIQPQYESILPFTEGLAAVGINLENWNYIDKSGKFITKLELEKAESFSDGLAMVFDKGKGCCYLDKTGKIALSFDSIGRAESFSEGLAPATYIRKKTFQGWGYLDKTGKFAISPNKEFYGAYNFSEGLARVQVDGENGKWGYIDKTGKFIIKPQFDYAWDFSEGLARVNMGGKLPASKSEYEYVSKKKSETSYMARAFTGGKWGYIDKTGKIIIKPQFNTAENFSEGLAAVRKTNRFLRKINLFFFPGSTFGHKCGFIDKTGKFAFTTPWYDEMDGFSGGLAWIDIRGKYGYIDTTGKYIWEPTK
jgi:hypothetical protein